MNHEITMNRNKLLDYESSFLNDIYKNIIDSISDVILIIDPNTFKIVNANQAALKQLQMSREEIIGNFCYEITHHLSEPCKPPHDTCPIYELLTTGKSVSADHTHFDSLNNENYVEVSAHPVKNREGKIVLVTHIAKDISERKLLQEKLLHAERLSTIGEIALTIANDLRNPLQVMQIAAYWLNNDYSRRENSPEGMKMLQTLNDSINYSDKIVKQLLDYTSSKAPITKLVNVNSVVTNALEQVQKTRIVEIKTEFGQIPQIEADEEMLKRVFLSLAENGITAMKRGGLLLVSTKGRADFVEVGFSDAGVGIPREDLDKLFKPMFSTKSKGMGLSLAICKKFVEAHEGNIIVESVEGKGTDVKVTLPIRHTRVNSKYTLNPNH